MDGYTALLIATPCAYLLGSVNMSILLARLRLIEDPRATPGGNPGVTNVARRAGFLWAGVVLFLDVGRAAGIAWAASVCLHPETTLVVLPALLLGNIYPFCHGWKGGKGVANYLGFTLVLAPIYAGVACALWVGVYKWRRVSFIASFSMVATMSAGLLVAHWALPYNVSAVVVAMGLVGYAHRPNIVVWRAAGRDRCSGRAPGEAETEPEVPRVGSPRPQRNGERRDDGS